MLSTTKTPISGLAVYLVISLLVVSVGCQQRMSSKLQGRWEGHPDSAARRAVREAAKYGDEFAKPFSVAENGSAAKTSESAQVTDWQRYEVTIVMDFTINDRLEMSLNGEQPRSGSWKIVSTSPAGCTIEVLTENDDKETSLERRRFDLLLDERDGICVGFQLTETGADPQLGALYFRRPES